MYLWKSVYVSDTVTVAFQELGLLIKVGGDVQLFD